MVYGPSYPAGGSIIFSPQTTPESARAVLRALHWDSMGLGNGEPILLTDKKSGRPAGVFGPPVSDILQIAMEQGAQPAERDSNGEPQVRVSKFRILTETIKKFKADMKDIGYKWEPRPDITIPVKTATPAQPRVLN